MERIIQAKHRINTCCGCKLGVDGGVNEQTFETLCGYADVVVVGGLLFNAPDAGNQWRALLERVAQLRQ